MSFLSQSNLTWADLLQSNRQGQVSNRCPMREFQSQSTEENLSYQAPSTTAVLPSSRIPLWRQEIYFWLQVDNPGGDLQEFSERPHTGWQIRRLRDDKSLFVP